MATPTTTDALLDALTAHFIKPDQTWAGAVCLTEVTAPGNSNRRADLVHVGLWASRGAGGIDVCELKTSRSDFRREIDQPAKAEAWWPYSSRFWIVSPSVEVTPPGELPPGWGLMVPGRARRFKTVVAPAEREPKITTGLLVTLLKATETTRVNAVERERDRLRAAHRQEMQEVRREAQMRALPSAERQRLELLDQLEAALGMTLDRYPWGNQIRPEDAAEALRTLAAGQAAWSAAQEETRRKATNIARMAEELQQRAAALLQAAPERLEAAS